MVERKPEIVFKQADFSKLKVIESLDNFPLWSTRVKANLLSAGLWDEKLSVPTTTNETTSLLLSLVADHFLIPLMDQTLTAPLIWTTLNSLYHVSNLSTKVTSLNQLISFHFQGPTMLSNRSMLQETKRKISSAFGGATTLSIDELVMLFAMVNLPSAYSPLRSQLSVSNSDDKPLTLDSLFSHLMREESTHTASSTNSVHRAATFPPVSRPSSCPHGRSKESCFTCTPSSRPVCSICKNLGKAKFLHSPNSVFCRQQRKLPPENDSKSGFSSASTPSKGVSFANSTPSAHLAAQSLTFVVDSGATNHVVANKEGVEIYSPSSLPISIADGTLISTAGLASFSSNPPLSDILVAPSFTQNLLSTYQLARSGYITVFDENNVYIAKHAHLEGTIASGHQQNGSYHLTLASSPNRLSNSPLFTQNPPENSPVACASTIDNTIDGWHLRLNHLHEKALQQLARSGVLPFSPDATLLPCQGCLVGKCKSGTPPQQSQTVVNQSGDIIVGDLTGPISPISIAGYLYIFTLTDVCSRYVTIYLLKTKHDANYHFIKYANQFRNKFGRNIKVFRSDGGSEFINNEMTQYCHEQGIIQEQTIRHSSHQNGIAERMFYTLLDSVRAMLHSSGLSRQHWDSAVRYAATTRNLSPTSSTSTIPYQAWHGTPPDYTALRPFGCPCVYLVDQVDRQYHLMNGSTKLVRGQTARFLGFAPNAKGYLLLLPDNSTITARFEQVTFTNSQSTSQNPPASSTHPLDTPVIDSTSTPYLASIQPESSDISDSSSEYSTASRQSDFDSDDFIPSTPAPTFTSIPIPSPVVPTPASPSLIPVPALPAHQDSIAVDPSILPKQTIVISQPSGPSNSIIYKNASAGKWKYTLPAKPPKERPTTINQSSILPPSSRRTRKPIDYSSAFPAIVTSVAPCDPSPSCTLCYDWFKCPLPSAYRSTIPLTYADIADRPDSDDWYKCSDDEIAQLLTEETWELVPCPPDRKPIKSKWVYRIKRDSLGNVIKYKGRLCACGYSQVHGVDYHEVYSPVIRAESIKLLLAIAAYLDMDVHQMDVVGAFLNGEQDVDIYMQQPAGYVDKDHPDWVCHLHRNLYGLKQAPRVWHQVIKAFLLSQDFKPCPVDPCLFMKVVAGKHTIIGLYVDDLLICSNSGSDLASMKQSLHSKFKMTDEGELTHFLQLEVTRNRTARTLSLSQRHYVEELLDKYEEYVPPAAGIPMKIGLKLSTDGPAPGSAEHQAMALIPYRQIVGQLVYLSRTTRLDISQAVGVVCRYLHNPGQEHWKAVQKILAYLKKIPDLPLVLGGNSPDTIGELGLTAYCDSNWETDRSTSGFLVFYGSSPVAWSSKRQAVVASSSVYAELISVYHTSAEIVWMRNVLDFLGQVLPSPPTVLYTDSEGALAHTKDHRVTPRNKHWDPKYHYVRELKENGTILFKHIPGTQNPADFLTKSVSRSKLLSSILHTPIV